MIINKIDETWLIRKIKMRNLSADKKFTLWLNVNLLWTKYPNIAIKNLAIELAIYKLSKAK